MRVIVHKGWELAGSLIVLRAALERAKMWLPHMSQIRPNTLKFILEPGIAAGTIIISELNSKGGKIIMVRKRSYIRWGRLQSQTKRAES